jgi:flagellar motor component MotA
VETYTVTLLHLWLMVCLPVIVPASDGKQSITRTTTAQSLLYITVVFLAFLMEPVRLQHLVKLTSFWGLCATAAISFGVSFMLDVTSAAPIARFFVALFSVATASAVQKYALVETVILLSSRRRQYSAILLETFLGSV